MRGERSADASDETDAGDTDIEENAEARDADSTEEEQAGETAVEDRTVEKQSGTDRQDAAAPVITSQPGDVSAAEGEAVSLTVAAAGSSLTYQWQWSRDSSRWRNCTSAGYNTDTFRFSMVPALDGRYYRCAVTGGGATVYSEGARITLAESTLEITVQPESVEAAAGERVDLHVEANRSDVSYQWQWSTDNSRWRNCTSAGYNTDMFGFSMVQALDGRYYRCLVTDGSEKVYSEGAQITLAETELVIDDVVYAVVDGKMTVTGYRGNAASVTVQQTVDGQTVTVIGESAFENKTCLTQIDLPDTIQVIGRRAFAGCCNLVKMD